VSVFTKIPLSGSTDGRGKKIVATAIATGDVIHTATSDATLPDLVTIFAYNSDTVARVLTLGWGGTTDPDDLIKTSIPSQSGLTIVTADMLLRNGLVIRAAASVANVIVVWGYVNRIS
jgi:hypothetical protein